MHTFLAVNLAQVDEEGFAILVELRSVGFGEGLQQSADLLLPALSQFNLLSACYLALLVASREVLEAVLVFQARDSFWVCLEVQPQRALDSDLVETEVGV